ncbi:MAG: hypothetical protein AAFV62_10880 [Pseudomonadota bacterium]
MTFGTPSIPDLIGITGAVMVLYAYWAVSNQRVSPTGAAFHGLNGGAAVLLLISLAYNPNPGSILIEIVYLAIATQGLWRAWGRRRNPPR